MTSVLARPWLRGAEAYVYGVPLIMMDLTREAAAAATVGEITAPVNQFSVMTRYPDASFRAVTRTGLDTLFAVAWADLEEEPLVLSVPDTGGRYYVIALFDMWSNVFASIGKRTTGTAAADFLIAGPGWQGTPPADVATTFRSPTRFVWVNGQMQADGPQECAAVTALQRQYKLTPLSAWGTRSWSPPAEVPLPAAVDKPPPLERLQQMDAGAFFGRLARLMKDNPPAPADAKIIKRLEAVGIEPGKDFDIAAVDRHIAKGLQRAMGTFGILEKALKRMKTENGWIVIPENFADYGTDYKTRAGIALIGLGGIWRQDVVYPTAFRDGDGKPLDGANRYVLHFDKGQMPPTNATWSVSMYDPQGYYVPNPVNRYNLAAWMPLQYNPDGSLDLYIQAESPGEEEESNWLPAPASGAFSLTVRIFWPTDAVLDGTYKLPPVKTSNESIQGGMMHLPKLSAKLPQDDQGAKLMRFDDVRGERYTEIFLIGGHAITHHLVGGVYNTIGLNTSNGGGDTCPQALLDKVDVEALKEEYDVLSAFKNGPRLWTLDWVEVMVGEERDFNGLKARWVTWLDVPEEMRKHESVAYKEIGVERDTQFGINKGSPAFILDDPNGDCWVMKSASLIVDPNQTYEGLKDLGARLRPAPGWRFRAVVLEQDLVLRPDHGKAKITQDELGNTYDRAGGAYSNYKP